METRHFLNKGISLKKSIFIMVLSLSIISSCTEEIDENQDEGPCAKGNVEVFNNTGELIYVGVYATNNQGYHTFAQSCGFNKDASYTFKSVPAGSIEIKAKLMGILGESEWTCFQSEIYGCETISFYIDNLK